MAASNTHTLESCLDEIFVETSITLKPKQIEAIKNIYIGKDTLCILPTAFGKSIIYQCLPKLFSMMESSQAQPVVVVISPLVALMQNQVEESNKLSYLGLKSSILDITLMKEIKSGSGKFNLLFGTPESWISDKWREVLGSTFMLDNLICIVVDEVHKVTWGQSSSKNSKPFRETFSRIGELRSACRQNVPVLALSATIDIDLQSLVKSSCNLSKSVKIISTCSNRDNIFLEVKQVPKQENIECLQWIVDLLSTKGFETPKIVIFCRSIDTAGLVYSELKRFFSKRNSEIDPKKLIGIFHSNTKPKKKEIVMTTLTTLDCPMRVVVATSSLGCGINMKNVKYIIHFGLAYHLVDYCQQIGRAGRGETSISHAILYNFPQGGTTISRSMRKYSSKANEGCLRTALFTPFNDNNEQVSPKQPNHLCCSFCATNCQCGGLCCEGLKVPDAMDCESSEPKIPVRNVTPDDEKLVRNLLIESHENQCSFLPLLTPPELVTGLNEQIISKVVENLEYIDSVEYILKNIHVIDLKCAREIAIIVKEVFIDVDDEEKAFLDLKFDDEHTELLNSSRGPIMFDEYSDFSASSEGGSLNDSDSDYD